MYEATFVRKDGLDDTLVGNPYHLNARTLPDAEDEALALPRPEGANFIKLSRVGGLVEREIGFAL